MKTPPSPRIPGMILLFAGMLLISSCEKHARVLTFDDVYDVSGILNLDNSIDTSASVTSLANIVSNIQLNVPQAMTTDKLDEICATLEKNLELTQDETDRLLRNDPDALMEVLERFGNLPAEFGDKNMDFSELENTDMRRHMLVEKEAPGIDYYPDDYYSAVQAYRKYVEKCIIKPLKHIRIIELHSQSQLPRGAHFEYYVFIKMNHHWAMWWSYWRYGNCIYKIRHKGGWGSFPH